MEIKWVVKTNREEIKISNVNQWILKPNKDNNR